MGQLWWVVLLFYLDILHFFISLHPQLRLVSVQRTKDETHPEWTEHIFLGKFYSKLIVKNSMLKQTHVSLINIVNTQHRLGELIEINKRKTCSHWVPILLTWFPHISYHQKKKRLHYGKHYAQYCHSCLVLFSKRNNPGSMPVHHCC